MKFSILGFSQEKAVELGLTSNDLLVLRWFVDFSGTSKMKKVFIGDNVYYWINYKTVLDDLPILKISKQTLYKKHFINLCNSKVLEHMQITEGGSFSYYCYGINYDKLIYLQENTPLLEKDTPKSISTEGLIKNYITPKSISTDPLSPNLTSKDTSIIDNSINDTSINDNEDVFIEDDVEIVVDDKFELFWETYNYKSGKADSKKSWKKIVKANKIDIYMIITKAKEYADHMKLNNSKQYMKLPKTWLNGEHWDSELPTFSSNNYKAKDKIIKVNKEVELNEDAYIAESEDSF